MSTSPSSDDKSQRLEQIVAYLDGELSPDASADVEQRLAADNDFRQELQSIDRAWTALDELPSTVVDDKFLQTTMELVVDSAQREIAEKTQALPVIQRRRQVSKVLLSIAAALLGVLVFRLAWTNPNQLLLADLPVIYQLEVYSQFEQTEFLRMLDQQVTVSDWPISNEEFTTQQQQLPLVAAADTRRAWLTNIPDDQRVMLRANYNRFLGLPLAEKQRLRSLNEQIESADDGQQLQRTLIRYEHWLNDMSAGEQYSLREQPAKERANRVASMVHERAKDDALNLTPSELKKLWASIKPKFDKLRERELRDLSEGERKELRRQKSDSRRRFSDWMFRVNPKRMEEIIYPIVTEALPEEARQQFALLHPREKQEQLLGWMRQSQGRDGEALQQDLEEFFVEELDEDEKQRLLALPHDQMQQELVRMYRGAPPHRDWSGPRGFGPRPPLERGPPPRPGDFRRDHQDDNRPRRGGRGASRPPHEGGRRGSPPPERP